MKGLIIIFLLWCILAVPVGAAFAYVEGRVNNKPPRYRNAILWSVFAGVIGWIVIAMRSGLNFSSKFGESQKLQAEVARRQLADMDKNKSDGAAG